MSWRFLRIRVINTFVVKPPHEIFNCGKFDTMRDEGQPHTVQTQWSLVADQGLWSVVRHPSEQGAHAHGLRVHERSAVISPHVIVFMRWSTCCIITNSMKKQLKLYFYHQSQIPRTLARLSLLLSFFMRRQHCLNCEHR